MAKHTIADGSDFAAAILGLLDESEAAQPLLLEAATEHDTPRARSERQREAVERNNNLPEFPVVYFVQEQSSSGYIKIGFATRIADRLSGLHTANPYGIKLLGCVAGSKQLEGDLQYRFSEHRFRAEWFYPVQAILDFVADINHKS